MSAYLGFVGPKDKPMDFIADGLYNVWQGYAKKEWTWRLRNNAGFSDLGYAILGNKYEDSWMVYRTKLQVADGDFKGQINPFSTLLTNTESAHHQIPASAVIFEITMSAYDGSHAPLNTTRFGAMGVVGQITSFMEDVVGVAKDSPDPWVGGGLGFMKWLEEGTDDDRLQRVARCDTHEIYIAACDRKRAILVRSQGATKTERQFVSRTDSGVIFCSSQYALSQTGATNIELVPLGTMKTYPIYE